MTIVEKIGLGFLVLDAAGRWVGIYATREAAQERAREQELVEAGLWDARCRLWAAEQSNDLERTVAARAIVGHYSRKAKGA